MDRKSQAETAVDGPAGQVYRLRLLGLERELPIRRLTAQIATPSFVMLGDVELIERCAEELARRLPAGRIDLLVAPEAKAIPLVHSLALRLGVDYVVARKSVKAYMREEIVEPVQSITTKEPQRLVLDGRDAARLRGKAVCILDDVVATGGTLDALERLLVKAGGRVICRAAVLREDAGYQGDDLIYIQEHPVFRLK